MPDVDPALLEALREGSGLSIDLEGRFRHRGEPITHRRTLEVLWSSLERRADGRYLVHVGRESAYVAVEDAPFAVRGVSLGDPSGAVVHLSDGSVEPLAAGTLAVDGDGVLHCRVKGGRHRARFTRSAQVAIGLELHEDPAAPSGFSLALSGRTYAVGRE
jgi:hypothetical protein